MIDLLFKSRIQKDILRIFFSNTEGSFYGRELARKVGTSAGNTHKVLKRLEDAGFLETNERGNLKFYFVNRTHPLFFELKRIVDKTVGIEYQLRVGIKSLKGLKFAFIFGSYAKGDFEADSDIDVFVIGNVDEGELIKKIKKVEEVVGREVNFHISDVGEFVEKLRKKSFYKDIIQNCILLTDNDGEFKKLIGKA
jgi:predicted nucleotidyltransferase